MQFSVSVLFQKQFEMFLSVQSTLCSCFAVSVKSSANINTVIQLNPLDWNKMKLIRSKQASKGFTWYNVSHAIRFPTWWLSPFPYFAPVVISYLLKHLEIHMDSLHLSHELCCCFEFNTPPHHLWQDKSRNKQSHKMRFTNSIKITEVCLTTLARNVRSALACFGCATFREGFHHCWQLIEMVILFLFKRL